MLRFVFLLTFVMTAFLSNANAEPASVAEQVPPSQTAAAMETPLAAEVETPANPAAEPASEPGQAENTAETTVSPIETK